jgi:hypothetical protein
MIIVRLDTIKIKDAKAFVEGMRYNTHLQGLWYVLHDGWDQVAMIGGTGVTAHLLSPPLSFSSKRQPPRPSLPQDAEVSH